MLKVLIETNQTKPHMTVFFSYILEIIINSIKILNWNIIVERREYYFGYSHLVYTSTLFFFLGVIYPKYVSIIRLIILCG